MFHHNDLFGHIIPKKELTQLYLSLALRDFAISMISLFVPIYLYSELGYSMNQTLGFFIFYSVIFAITTPLGAKFSSRYGIKHSVLLSLPFYLLFLLLLYYLPNYNLPLILIAGSLGAAMGFYWIGINLIFFNSSHRNHRGEEFGKFRAARISGAMIGPLLGGFLITYFGFGAVFLIVSVFLLLSNLVLFLSKENHYPYHFSIRSLVNKDHWKNALFFVSFGSEMMATGVIWPLFIFIILGGYLSLGLVGSILPAGTAVLVWASGKFSDHYDKRKIIRWAVIFESIVWFFRAFVTTTFHVFGITILASLTNGIKVSPLGALVFDKAGKNPVGYFVNRELFLCFGRILMLSLVMMLNNLSGGFIFQSVANLAALLF